MLMPAAIAKQREIDNKVRVLARRLRPDVVSIKYEIAPDWSGDWGIFFRILLSDEAAEKRLHAVATNASAELNKTFDFPSLGVIPYPSFRSESEQAMLRDEAWA